MNRQQFGNIEATVEKNTVVLVGQWTLLLSKDHLSRTLKKKGTNDYTEGLLPMIHAGKFCLSVKPEPVAKICLDTNQIAALNNFLAMNK